MKLRSFRIQKYRNVLDSETVTLDDQLTSIVGKNQSGKTNVLRALHKLNPASPETYSIGRDWPRNDAMRPDAHHPVCTARFELDPGEEATIAAIIGREVIDRSVEIKKNYVGTFEITISTDAGLALDVPTPSEFEDLAERLPPPPAPPMNAFRSAAITCLAEARRATLEGRFEALEGLWSKHEPRLRTHGSAKPSQTESDFFAAYAAGLKEVLVAKETLAAPRRALHEYIVARIPTFIYMDEYHELAGVMRLEELQGRRRRNNLSGTDETFLILLKLLELDLDELIQAGASGEAEIKQVRQHQLRVAATRLTQIVRDLWQQNSFRIHFDVDGTLLMVNIERDGTRSIVSLQDESKGFRWFLGFVVLFMYGSKSSFSNCVLLLDEPGLHLHPGAQRDLLRSLEDYAATNLLIYTTHLPFLLDLRYPRRIKVIAQREHGAVITAELTGSQPDEKLTLQAALGIELGQHYLIGDRRNMVVEGAHDYWVLSELSSLLLRSDEEGLPDDILITPAGGAGHVVTLTTFMIGQGLGVLALFDSDDEGRKHEAVLREEWLLRYSQHHGCTVLLGDAVGAHGDCTLEDLFTPEYYLQCAWPDNATVRAKLIELVGKRQGPLGSRVAAACKELRIEYKKGSAAKLLRRDIARQSRITGLGEETASKVRALFGAVRKAFGANVPRSAAGA